MEVKWTEQQKEAVYAPVSNILVTAAAGAGKTQVLTGRILNRILSGADVSRMLIVTFTNAAAAEMKSRIASALSDELLKNPNNEHIAKQAVMLPLASIQTIHSFCLDVIKNNFFRTDISPDFKIADEAECKIMKAEAIEEALDMLYEENDRDFIDFTDSFSNAKNDNKAIEMVNSLFEFAESMPFPEEWLLKQCEIYENLNEDNFEKSYFAQTILKNVKDTLGECVWRLEDAKNQCEVADGLLPYCEMFEKDAEKVRELINFEGWDELRNAALEFNFDKKKVVRGGDEDVKNAVSKVRNDVKDDILSALLYVAHSKEENLEILSKTAPVLKGLVKCTLKFSEIYTQMKKEKKLVDFSDIEHICIKLLSEEDIAKERREYFEEIYVDEYQDSNAAQDYIFRAVSGERDGKPNIFMVGDVKQSIYGFRQTNPGLFLEKKDSYKFGDSQNRKIVLSKNFRSSRGIIDYINGVFGKIMSRAVGGVDYDEEEKLVLGASYPEGGKAAEIDVIELGEGAKSDDGIYAEAVFAAKKILSLIENEKVFDLKSGYERNTKFSDIAILMRSPKRSVGVFEDVFKEFNIPLFVDYDDGYFESAEAKTLLSLLTVIDNPENDIPLISVLRSPIGNFNEDELAKIRLFERGNSFYKALCSYAKDKSYLGKKCMAFSEMLKKFRKYSKYMPCHRLIDAVLSETGYFDAVCAMPGAADRAENISLLREQARNYEQSSYRGLYNFINYINNVKERSGNLGASKSISDSHNVVKIMSIHKSKGLEFPVVFLSGCARKMNTRDLSGDLILHNDCGIGISYADAERRVFGDTAIKVAAKLNKRQEELSEEIRVLYVALTRAKEKLILTASVKDAKKSMEKWQGLSRLAAKGFMIKENSYIDYIMAAHLCGGKDAVLNVLSPDECSADEKNEDKKIELSPDNDEEIKKLLEFEYSFKNFWEIPSKVTVSELKRMGEGAVDDVPQLYTDVNIKVPSFIKKETITPARRGQIMHFIMQNIGTDVENEKDVENFVFDLVQKNILTEEDAGVVDAEKIAAFFKSEIGQRLKKADKIFREEPFALAVSASRITGKNEDAGQLVMVQGIIDCYFFEGDNIVLIDYKTDKDTSEENIIKNYKKQLDIYGEALEKKYFKKIYEKFIYLFGNSGIIRID